MSARPANLDLHAVLLVLALADGGVDPGVRRVGGEVQADRHLRVGAGALIAAAARQGE
jgi:hypothetical protein